MSLPADIARCHDSTCQERLICRRWQERSVTGMGAVHVRTLYAPRRLPLVEAEDTLCAARIPTERAP